MKQSELGIRMATVGLCGLRLWARFPTETYRCPALLQMAFSYKKLCSGDKPHSSDPPSSYELKSSSSSSSSSRAMVKAKPSHVKPKGFKKGAKRLLQKVLGKCGSSEKKEKVKALTEVEGNTRTTAMVLMSKRELLSVNKKQEEEILRLKHMIENKNKEVEKSMDLCLNQREEIKSLKNSQLQELVEKQGSELKETKQVIPSLQQQASSLTGQTLNSLKQNRSFHHYSNMDLTEVKADKYSAKTGFQGYGSSPRTPPPHGREDASNSWEFSSEDMSDDLLLKDLNPCLTPYNANKSRSRDSLLDESLSEDDLKVYPELDDFNSYDQKFSKSSDCYHHNTGKIDKIGITTKAS